MLERLAIFLVRRRVAVILAVVAVTLVFMLFMYKLRINENFEESIYRGGTWPTRTCGARWTSWGTTT